MNVQLPDNSVVQFPDDMPMDQVHSAISSYLFPQQQVQPSTNLERIGYGMQQPINGIAQDMLHAAQYLPDILSPEGLKGADKYLDTDLTNQANQYQQQRAAAGSKGFDWDQTLGGMITTAPVAMALPGAGATTLAGRAGYGALSGASMGAMQPVTSGDYGYQKAKQVGTGAAVGSVLNPAMGAVGDVVNPKISPEVQTLLDAGITPTPGQIMGGGYKKTEEQISSVPYLGDVIKTGQKRALDQFNSAALGRALAPIGEAMPPATIGREGINYVNDKLGAAYTDVLPNLSLKLDEPFAASVEDAKTQLPASEQGKFDEIVGRQFQKFSAQGNLSGEPLKGFQSELSQASRGYSSDASYDARQLGSALDDVHAAFGQALQRSNPQYAEKLSNINEGYANYATLRRAQSGIKENGPFTPAQLAAAIRGNDTSVGKGSFAKGNALMQDLSDAGVSALGNNYPDSGTAGRAMMGIAGGALAGGHFSPGIAIGGGLAALPYMSPTTQKLAAALLSKRPAIAQPIGNALQSVTPFLANGGASAAVRQ